MISMGDAPPNKRMNLTVRPVTRLAVLQPIADANGNGQGARPSRPAGYPRRSTDSIRRAKEITLRLFLLLVTSTVLTFNVAVGQNDATRPADKPPIASQELGSIADSLQQIRSQLVTLSNQLDLQLKIGALATLDTDISTLSTELQRSLEARLPLDSALARLRATIATRELAATERAEQTTSQESLDQLNRRVEELRRSITSRQALLAELEKELKDRRGAGHK